MYLKQCMDNYIYNQYLEVSLCSSVDMNPDFNFFFLKKKKKKKKKITIEYD